MADEEGQPDQQFGAEGEEGAQPQQEVADDEAGGEALLEDEAGEGSDEDEEGEEGSLVDSSEEEDDEEGNEYEADGFVVDEAEVEEGEDDDDAVKKKKKKKKKNKKRRQAVLDDDEYDFLEEEGIRVQRPTGRKRLKRVEESREGDRGVQEMRAELFGDDELEDQLEDDDDDEEGGRGERRGDRAGGRRPGAGAGVRGRDGRRGEEARPAEEYGDDLDGDEMDDFIVDEGPGAGRRRRGFSEGMPHGISEAALQEAADIFGDVDMLLDTFYERKQQEEEPMDEDLDILPEEPGEDDDDEAMERRQQAREEAARKAVLRKAMRLLDAETLQSQYLMPEDQVIREKDLPERFQLLGVVQDEKDPLDLDQCAEWIYWVLFRAKSYEGRSMEQVADIVRQGIIEVDATVPSPNPDGEWPRPELLAMQNDLNVCSYGNLKLGSRRAVRRGRDHRQAEDWDTIPEAQEDLRKAIKQALSIMYERGEEPVVLGLYRKEHLGELAAMRGEDTPQVTSQAEEDERRNSYHNDPQRARAFPMQTVMPRHRRIRRFDALWAVMWLSLRYRKLSRRRAQLGARLETNVESLRDAGSEHEAEELSALNELLSQQCCEVHLDDLDSYLKLAQELHSLEPDLGSLTLDQSQGNGVKRGVVPGKAGSGRGGAANLQLYRKLYSLGVVRLLRNPAAKSPILLSAGQFAQVLQDPDVREHEPDEPDGEAVPPDQWLWDACQQEAIPVESNGILTAQTLMFRVKALAVHELASEPRVRAWARKYFDEHAVVTTRPTAQGLDHPSMEPYAKYGRVKYYKNKPIETFGKTDAFLRVVEAARERLITFTMELPKDALEKLLSNFGNLYTSQKFSAKAKLWNSLRQEIIKEAVETKLVPQAAAEARQRLLAQAKEAALDEYGAAFWKLASASPVRLMRDNEDEQGGEEYITPRIMSVCWGPGNNQPTVVVALNEQGGLVDLLPCGQLSGRVPRSMRGPGDSGGNTTAPSMTDPRKSKDMNRLLEKVLERKPLALVVGISDPSAAIVRQDLQFLLDYLLDVHAKFIQELETANIELLPADEKLAALWQDCKAAKDEFPEQPPHVRRAIALGRLQLDPLPVLAALCGPRAEVLSLPLTEMQGCLMEADRMRAIEQIMVTATAQVGLDINLAANVGWHQHLLQFVPGLGPRKAQALLQAVARNANKVDSRNFMYKELGDVLGRNVFRNCGGILRVTSAGLQHLANLELRQLDDSRIHPESYKLAVAMCVKATGEADVEAAVEESKDKIEVVDLVSLAEEKQCSNKLATIIDIQLELLAPFGEVRPPAKPLGEKECFLLQHGETEQTLCMGRLVEARVVFIGREEVKVRLTHCPIDGVIKRENLSSSDQWRKTDLRDLLQRDQVLQCRVLNIDDQYKRPGSQANQVVVTLSSTADDMDPGKWEDLYCGRGVGEHYYDVPNADERQRALEEAERAARGTPGRGAPGTPGRAGAPGTPSRGGHSTPNRDERGSDKFQARPIHHPLYMNCSQREVIATLSQSSKPIGTCIIHPTPKPPGLFLTVKAYQDPNELNAVVHRLKISEADTPRPQFQLSTPIKVDLSHAGIAPEHSPEFEDLDELHARFVEPLTDQFRRIAGHKKFEKGSKQAVSEQTKREYQHRQDQILPYHLFMSSEKGVTQFGIAFAFGSSSAPEGCRVHHEYFWPRHDGFWFRKACYTDLDKLIARFKKEPISKDRKQDRQNLGYDMPTTGNVAMAPQVARQGGYQQMPTNYHQPPGGYYQGGYQGQYQQGPPQAVYGSYGYQQGYNNAAGQGSYGGYQAGGGGGYGGGGYGGGGATPPSTGRGRSKWDQGPAAGAPAGGAYGAAPVPGPPPGGAYGGGGGYGGGGPGGYGGGGGGADYNGRGPAGAYGGGPAAHSGAYGAPAPGQGAPRASGFSAGPPPPPPPQAGRSPPLYQ